MMSLINSYNPWESQGMKKVYQKRGFNFKYNYINLIVEYISVETLLIGGNCVSYLNLILYLIFSLLIILFTQSACFFVLNAPVGIVSYFIQKDPSEQRIEKFTTRFFVVVVFSSVETLMPVGLFLIIVRTDLYVFSQYSLRRRRAIVFVKGGVHAGYSSARSFVILSSSYIEKGFASQNMAYTVVFCRYLNFSSNRRIIGVSLVIPRVV